MTRINLGIYPYELCDQMLVAEYRELPRIRTLLIGRMQRDCFLEVPAFFRLGEGHMRFFMDKGEYLRLRWFSLRREMMHRGFSVTLNWRVWPPRFLGRDLQQTISIKEQRRARPLLIERINQRLYEMKRRPIWTYNNPPAWARSSAVEHQPLEL